MCHSYFFCKYSKKVLILPPIVKKVNERAFYSVCDQYSPKYFLSDTNKKKINGF